MITSMVEAGIPIIQPIFAVAPWLIAAGVSGLLGMRKAQAARGAEDRRKNLHAAAQQYSGFTGKMPGVYEPGASPDDIGGFLGGAMPVALQAGATGWGDKVSPTAMTGPSPAPGLGVDTSMPGASATGLGTSASAALEAPQNSSWLEALKAMGVKKPVQPTLLYVGKNPEDEAPIY